MPDEADDELIANYIRNYTQPMQWVCWWNEVSDDDAKKSLGGALFESDGDRLRDLTSPILREEVIRVVMGSRPLLLSVGAEVIRILDEAAEEAAEDQDVDA